jgi:hypothetical protein
VFAAVCHYCGLEYWSHNRRRLYCSERCRRSYQNDRRKDERAERAEESEAWHEAAPWQQDPWERNDLENWEDIFTNALLDPPPQDDAPWDAPVKPVVKANRKKRKNENWMWLPGLSVPQ